MSDRKLLQDQNETPDDVASLYSWANLHGAKYRDFSASRAQAREKARLRVQQAMEAEKEQARQQTEAQQSEAAQRAEKADRAAEAASAAAAQQEAAERSTRQTAEEAAQQAAQQAAQERARQSLQEAAQKAALAAARERANPVRTAEILAAQWAPPAAPPAGWQPPQPERIGAAVPLAAPQTPFPAYSAAPPARAAKPLMPQPREEPATMQNSPAPWPARETRDATARPAWLAQRAEPVVASAVSRAPEDTIQGSRDRLTSRWFALKGVFEGASANTTPETASVPSVFRAPVLAVFSLAGGVGKTSLIATLGRALSARGERVLLVDTAAFGLLPFFFGARDQRPGQLRTFGPPQTSGDAPIQMIALDPDTLGPENAAQEVLTSEIAQYGQGASRILVDLSTASGTLTRRILKFSPQVLVPVVPDMNSVVSVSSIDSFFQHNGGLAGKLPYYVLNQFDPSLPLHLDVREVLREQLGDRLLPFALRRAPVVSEALAEGMTVMDYAPASTIADDFSNLAGWVKNLSAPASSGFRGIRWSER